MGPDLRAEVLLLAGASGSGKTTLVDRLVARYGVTVVQLDDFYLEGDHESLPHRHGIVDWDDTASWDADAATAALLSLCQDGTVDVPVYDIASSRRTGSRRLTALPGSLVVAEGIFAPHLVSRCHELGLLADAVHLHHHRSVTFIRRLVRDLAGRRKPPLTLVRRGLALAREEPALLQHWAALGTRPATKAEVAHLVAARHRGVTRELRPRHADGSGRN